MNGFRHLNNGAAGHYVEEGRADLNMRICAVDCMVNPPGKPARLADPERKTIHSLVLRG